MKHILSFLGGVAVGFLVVLSLGGVSWFQGTNIDFPRINKVSSTTVAATTSTTSAAATRLCQPGFLPLISRVSYTQLAWYLRLHREHKDGLRSVMPTLGAPRTPSELAPLLDRPQKPSDIVIMPAQSKNYMFDVSDYLRPFRVVEIGSRDCPHAEALLAQMNARLPPDIPIELHLVDSWGYRGPEEVVDNNNEAQGKKNMADCKKLLAPYVKRRDSDVLITIHYHRNLSVPTAQTFPDQYFDLVYIDALHTYSATRDDFNAWWPKAKAGSLVCGDDYGDMHWSDWYGGSVFGHNLMKWYKWGVSRAVEEFAVAHNVVVVPTVSEFHQLRPPQNRVYGQNSSFPSHPVPQDFYMIKPHPHFTGDCTQIIVTQHV